MVRRIHLSRLHLGLIPLAPAQAHHARDVLRLQEGATVEVFDDDGAVARGVLVFPSPTEVHVRIGQIDPPLSEDPLTWAVASAVPKGERADWMVEKLSELGAAAFIPLISARAVVLPEGRGKRDRWNRLAAEASKQSRRRGVMRIEELTPLARAIEHTQHDEAQAAWVLSMAPAAVPIIELAAANPLPRRLTLFIGPEGGWTQEELASFDSAGVKLVRLTTTVLRVETAALAAAAVVACARL